MQKKRIFPERNAPHAVNYAEKDGTVAARPGDAWPFPLAFDHFPDLHLRESGLQYTDVGLDFGKLLPIAPRLVEVGETDS